ncbi:hypothetical protein C8R43DRAFT_956070 [Mycena crocata]|nr:hypothetical protein C8R43DRAFT_956070 [Mycena crocata]
MVAADFHMVAAGGTWAKLAFKAACTSPMMVLVAFRWCQSLSVGVSRFPQYLLPQFLYSPVRRGLVNHQEKEKEKRVKNLFVEASCTDGESNPGPTHKHTATSATDKQEREGRYRKSRADQRHEKEERNQLQLQYSYILDEEQAPTGIPNLDPLRNVLVAHQIWRGTSHFMIPEEKE